MTEVSAFWNGTTLGDAAYAPYDANSVTSLILSDLGMYAPNANRGGVLLDSTIGTGVLLVTGTSSPVSVVAGRGFVYGTWYESTTPTTIVVPTPVSATRIDLIVLRKSWAAQTVRQTLIEGVEGGGAPAMVQTSGVTWDVPLAQISTTTGGVITVTDTRQLVPGVGNGLGTFASPNITGTVTGGAIYDLATFLQSATFPGNVPVKYPEVGPLVTQQASIVLNIPAGWRHFRIKAQHADGSGDATTTNDVLIAINADTTAGDYSTPLAESVGSSWSPAANGLAQSVGNTSNGPDDNSSWVAEFLNYAQTTFWKQYQVSGGLSYGGGGAFTRFRLYGQWQSTAAITSVTLTLSAGAQFQPGSVFTVYLEP